jgi:hypothetical protein
MSVEQVVEWKLAGATEVLGENLHQRHFLHPYTTWLDLGSKPGRCGGKPATNGLSYGAAKPATNGLSYGAAKPATNGLSYGAAKPATST